MARTRNCSHDLLREFAI
jgi:hypothetical protein